MDVFLKDGLIITHKIIYYFLKIEEYVAIFTSSF